MCRASRPCKHSHCHPCLTDGQPLSMPNKKPTCPSETENQASPLTKKTRAIRRHLERMKYEHRPFRLCTSEMLDDYLVIEHFVKSITAVGWCRNFMYQCSGFTVLRRRLQTRSMLLSWTICVKPSETRVASFDLKHVMLGVARKGEGAVLSTYRHRHHGCKDSLAADFRLGFVLKARRLPCCSPGSLQTTPMHCVCHARCD